MLTELRQLLPCIFQRGKPLHVQTLVPQSAVEAFDESILHRPSWPDKTQLHVVSIAQASSARLQNSLPLSRVMLSGKLPRSHFARSSAWATFIPVIERSASSHTH